MGSVRGDAGEAPPALASATTALCDPPIALLHTRPPVIPSHLYLLHSAVMPTTLCIMSSYTATQPICFSPDISSDRAYTA